MTERSETGAGRTLGFKKENNVHLIDLVRRKDRVPRVDEQAGKGGRGVQAPRLSILRKPYRKSERSSGRAQGAKSEACSVHSGPVLLPCPLPLTFRTENKNKMKGKSEQPRKRKREATRESAECGTQCPISPASTPAASAHLHGTPQTLCSSQGACSWDNPTAGRQKEVCDITHDEQGQKQKKGASDSATTQMGWQCQGG